MAPSPRPITPPPSTHSRTPGTIPPSPLTPEQVRRIEESRLRAKALRQNALSEQASSGVETLRTPSGYVAGQKRSAPSDRETRGSTREARKSIRDGTDHLAAVTTTTTQKHVPPHLSRTESVHSNAASDPKGAGQATGLDAIQPARKFAKYVEYDFSAMQDSKGGFLSAEDDPFNKALHTDARPGVDDVKPPHMTLKEWERYRLLKQLRERRDGPYAPGLSVIDPAQTAKKACRECGSLEIDWKWEEVFGCCVCNACKDKVPDKYSLLTKSEAREDYLLTEPELKDANLLPHLELPNPHKSTWHNMMLFLRFQVEEYAFSERKWGSAEALDAEFARRTAETKRRKDVKFQKKFAELKKRTQYDAYQRKRKAAGGAAFGESLEKEGKHEHEWGRATRNTETGVEVKRCVECGLEVEELSF